MAKLKPALTRLFRSPFTVRYSPTFFVQPLDVTREYVHFKRILLI